MFMGVRLLSHGFDLVSPTFSVVYHLWMRDYRKTYWDHDIVVQVNHLDNYSLNECRETSLSLWSKISCVEK
jgi:hypothetical protein